MIAVAASAHLAFAQQTTLKVKASITLYIEFGRI